MAMKMLSYVLRTNSKPNKEYLSSIRKDLIRIEGQNTKIAEYWARAPVKDRCGGVWVAIKYCEIPNDGVLRIQTEFVVSNSCIGNQSINACH